MASIQFPLAQVQLFFLVFLRVSIILVILPLFDSRSIPPMLKAGLALAVSILVFPLLNVKQMPLITEAIPFGLGVVTELILGFAIGLSVRLIFAGIQLAGQLAGYQMGFGIVNVMDPLNHAQVSIMAHLSYLIAILIFLSVNAHHWFLYAMADSFQVIPPMEFHIAGTLTGQMVDLAAEMFTIAIKISAPIMVVLLLTSVALGVVSRTVPQMNIFIVAFPLKIFVGIIFFILTLPYLSAYMQEMYGGIGQIVTGVLQSGR